jgi:hypothetical protein
MKRLFFILLVILNINIYAGNNSLSVKAGANYSTFNVQYFYEVLDYFPEYPEDSYTFGGVLYLSWERNNFFSKNLYLNIDIGLNQKGLKQDYSTGTINKHYLSAEIPIILGYRFYNNIKLYFGGYSSLLFYQTTDNHSEFTIFQDKKGGGIMIDCGVLLGVEYEYKNYFFNFRFQQGVVAADEGYDQYGDLASKTENNRQFVFMLGYKFF